MRVLGRDETLGGDETLKHLGEPCSAVIHAHLYKYTFFEVRQTAIPREPGSEVGGLGQVLSEGHAEDKPCNLGFSLKLFSHILHVYSPASARPFHEF